MSKDTALPESIRTLAGVVSRINHKASAADNQKLKGLTP